jgi:TonB family protein
MCFKKQYSQTRVFIAHTLNLLFVFSMLNISAQENNLDKTEQDQEEYQITIVDKIPQFQGGSDALLKFLASIKYPEEARDKGIEGSVYVRFVIESSGKVTNAEVARGTNVILDNAAVEHVRNMPDWIPGEQKGKKVKVQYVVPIRFCLSGNNKKSNSEKHEMVQTPKFPDGDEALIKYLATVDYPKEAIEKKIEGNVHVKFTIDQNGKVKNPEVVKKVNPLLDKAALEHIANMPDWIAGTRDGIAYSSSSTIEIVFKTKTKTLNSDYYYNEGVALFQKGIIEEALVNFEKAYELKNNDIDALFNAGICKYKLGKINEACESWKKIQQTGSQIADIQISKYCSRE